jgi:hypothetical protein
MRIITITLVLCFVTLFLQACLTHYVLESDLRIQLVNNSEYSVGPLFAYNLKDPTDQDILIPVIVAPGQKSLVFSSDLNGILNLGVALPELPCGDTLCYREFLLGTKDLGSGSKVLEFEILNGKPALRFK